MNANHVGSLYPDGFGNFAVGSTNPPVAMGSTGNAVATIATVGTGYIVRRITAFNAFVAGLTGKGGLNTAIGETSPVRAESSASLPLSSSRPTVTKITTLFSSNFAK